MTPTVILEDAEGQWLFDALSRIAMPHWPWPIIFRVKSKNVFRVEMEVTERDTGVPHTVRPAAGRDVTTPEEALEQAAYMVDSMVKHEREEQWFIDGRPTFEPDRKPPQGR